MSLAEDSGSYAITHLTLMSDSLLRLSHERRWQPSNQREQSYAQPEGLIRC